jgi:hypothetical protein
MTELISAAQTNDLDNLSRLLDKEEVQNPHLSENGPNSSTSAMQAARNNHPAALGLLFDSGCWISPDIVVAALDGQSKAVFDSFVARGWNITLNFGHLGDVLMYVTNPSLSSFSNAPRQRSPTDLLIVSLRFFGEIGSESADCIARLPSITNNSCLSLYAYRIETQDRPKNR